MVTFFWAALTLWFNPWLHSLMLLLIWMNIVKMMRMVMVMIMMMIIVMMMMIYIYNGEVYVCVSQKSLFLYSKDLAVPHVSRHIPCWKNLVVSMFLDTFRTQRNWSFLTFIAHSVLKGIARFHVSWHFPYSKDLVVSHVYSYIPYSKNLVVSMFLDTFRIQEIWSFP